MSQESSLFPKQIKLDDYGEFIQGNVIRILQTSNLLVGSGARTSTASIVLAKTLHYLCEENILPLKGLNVLELGCGIGLLGVYLGCLGCNVVMADVPPVKSLAERNIGLNNAMIKGKVDFVVANWKNENLKKSEKMEVQSSTSSEQKEQNLQHLMPKVDITLVCEGGGLSDLQHQLNWIGKQGIIICFLEREINSPEDYLSRRNLEIFLEEKDMNYTKIEEFNPDYQDERVQIYRVFRK